MQQGSFRFRLDGSANRRLDGNYVKYRYKGNGDGRMMTLGSLFDGIGGFPLAAVHCGGVPVWASEIEPFPMRVTKLRFPDMIHVGDITNWMEQNCRLWM